MKLGTENRKKVAFLAVLGLVAVYLLYTNVFSGPAGTPDRGALHRRRNPRGRARGRLPGPEATPGQDTAADGGSGPKGHPAGFQPERL